jgi:homoserine kinase
MPQRPQEAELLIPASVSNLGPGFDALSVAVQLYIRVRVVELLPESPGVFEAAFLDAPPVGENRIEAAFRHAAARPGAAPPAGMRIAIRSEIPAGAGLGSSGAATIAGLRLYELATAPLALERLLAMANEMEGHPDNAAASLLGGLAVSCVHDDGRVTARTGRWPADLRFVVATPDTGLDTTRARSILPAAVPLQDAVFNLQRALLLVRALESGSYGDLREAMRDRWHQRIRASLVPGLDAALALDDPEILGVCLSGSGPSIVAIVAGDAEVAERRLREIYRGLGVAGTIRTLAAQQPCSSERL